MKNALALAVLCVVCSCAPSIATKPPALVFNGQWHLVPQMAVVPQSKPNDCARAAAQMVATRWGVPLTSDLTPADDDHGVNAGKVRDALAASGLKTFLIAATLKDLENETAAGRPTIVGVTFARSNKIYGHYEVVVGTSPVAGKVLVIDPQRGYLVQSYKDFETIWRATKYVAIVAAPAL